MRTNDIELTKISRGKATDKLLLKYIPESEVSKIDLILQSVRNDGLTEQSVQDKYRTPLIILRYVSDKDFLDCVRSDSKEINIWISNSSYSSSRKRQLRTAWKKALLVLHGVDDADAEDFELIKDLRPTKKEIKENRKYKTYMPRLSNLIKTDEEVQDKILSHVKLDRDKLKFAIDWDGALRCCESENANWNNIIEENGLTKFKITNAKDSGDDKSREIVLAFSLPYLNRWKQQYKEIFGIKRDEDLNGLYIFRKAEDKENKPLSHGHFIKLCNQIKIKSGIPDFSPKMFRKYCISKWERSGIPEALIRKLSGHTKNSRSIAHYSYHDQNDLDTALLKLNGIVKPEQQEEKKPCYIVCKRCTNKNLSNSENCEVCGFPLDSKKIIEYEQKLSSSLKITENIINNNEVLKNFIITELKNSIIRELKEEIEKQLKNK